MHSTVSGCGCQSATPLRGVKPDQDSALSDRLRDLWRWGPSVATPPATVIAGVPAPAAPHHHLWSVHDGEFNRLPERRRRQPVGVVMNRRCPVGVRSWRNGAL